MVPDGHARRRWLTALAILVAACNENQAPVPTAFALRDSAAWAGSEIRLVSPTGIDTTGITISLDTFALPIRLIDDTTIAARLPWQGGDFFLTVTVDGVPAFGPHSISVYGFLDAYTAPAMRGTMIPVRPGLPQLLAPGASGLALVDLRLRSELVFPDTVYSEPFCSILGPGPSYQPGVVVLARLVPGTTTCVRRTWRLTATNVLAALDTVPPAASGYLVAELGPGTWLSTGDITYCTHNASGTRCGTSSEPRGVRISPRGDRAVVLAWRSGGAPVLNIGDGTLAYAVTSAPRLMGAEFSPTGDTLYVANYGWSGGPDLYALDATTGTMLDSIAIDGTFTYSMDLLADPYRPYLYAANSDGLLVLDRASLRPVALLQPVIPCGGDCSMGIGRLVLSAGEGLLYAVTAGGTCGSCSAVPATVQRYRLPPSQ